jgi:hypothetical protein
MAYICTPREVAGLRSIRKKTICRLYPSWQNLEGNVDWEYVGNTVHYSTTDDTNNGNTLPHIYGRPYFGNIASNCSLPLVSGPNQQAILLQHNSDLGGHAGAWIECEIFSSTNTATGTGYLTTVTARLGFPQNLFSDMKVLRRDKPWLKVVGKFEVVKFKEKHEQTCTNVALVGTYDAFGNFIYPQYSNQTTLLVDETVENTITMTSFSEEFGTDSLDFNTSQNDATYTDPYGQVVTYQTYYMNETGSCYIDETSIYATIL